MAGCWPLSFILALRPTHSLMHTLTYARTHTHEPSLKVKYEHFEKRRKEKVKVVERERVNICNYMTKIKRGGNDEERGGGGDFSGTGGGSGFGVKVIEHTMAAATVSIKSPQKKSQAEEMKVIWKFSD